MKANNIFLLVDDDGDDRHLFTEAAGLIQPQITCYVSENGKQAIELLSDLSKQLPHVIFLDVNMPVMNGWNCLKELKSNERLKDIPVIMYSTTSHQREVDIACEMGAHCFCVKPEKFTLLKQILEVINKNIGSDLDVTFKSHPELFRFRKPQAY